MKSPPQKSSPFDTFCRALVLGAVLGALGWGAIRYTNLPQIALAKIVAWSNSTGTQHTTPPYQQSSLTTPSSTTSAISLPSVTQAPQHVPTDQGHFHPTQQAAYLEVMPTVTQTDPTLTQTPHIREAIEQRLRDLGAVYSLLEMWGNDSFRYRYHCRIAMANNRQVTRSFEANGENPEEAMREVLKAVEGFQSTGHLQGPQVH